MEKNKFRFLFLMFVFWNVVNVVFCDEATFTGVLEPSEKSMVRAKCRALLVENVEEGSFIRKGELLFQLDTTDLEEQKLTAESNLRKVIADQAVNKINYENRLIESKRKVIANQINYEIAKLNYEDLKAGANPADVKVSEEKVRLAELVHENSKIELGLIQKLVESGYISKEELDALVFRIQSEEEALKLLKEEHELIKQGPTSIEVEEARLLMDICEKNLESIKEQLNSLEKGYGELLQFQGRERKRYERKLEEVVENITDCVVTAPIDGTVFYERYPWGEKIVTGKDVWKGLVVRSVANLENMSVKIKIPVESIENYTLRQKAKVIILSSGKELEGEIIKVSPLQEDEFADAHNTTKEVLGSSNKKIFVVMVKILNFTSGLKPGMTAKVVLENKHES